MKPFWLIKRLNLKSILFNFKHFPFKDAIKFPVFITSYTHLKFTKSAHFKINCENKYPGMIRIGYEKVGIFDKKTTSTILEVNGEIVFNGSAYIGTGSKISVLNDARLEFGNNFTITSKSNIICSKRIIIGNDCLLSWDITIMDTDFHKLLDLNNRVLNMPKEIIIGNKVWIGFNTIVLKGSIIGNNNVIASNSLITKAYPQENSVIGGNPSRIIKSEVKWEL